MSALFINVNRNGYTTDQCGRTLTAAELIEILEGFDEDTPVYLSNDNGYTFGSIKEEDIHESEEDYEPIDADGGY